VSGRRARQLRQLAEAMCAAQNIQDRPGYAPTEVRDRDGKVVGRWPELRLLPGPRALARQMRRTRTVPVDVRAAVPYRRADLVRTLRKEIHQ
jgi:hypothetical protein